MTDANATPDARTRAALRDLPSVDVIASAICERWGDRVPRSLVSDAARRVIDGWRERLRDGRESACDHDRIRRETDAAVAALVDDSLRPVLNATGILLHTGLGRASIAPAAVRAMTAAAAEPVPVEIDMVSGRRGRRTEHVAGLLRALTGAEAATVVNNGAGALLLALAATAAPGAVVVSRGELVEIGGSFRLPDVIEAGGARLLEVGTTNRTRASDYERAIAAASDASTIGAMLTVHASNFRIEGFTEAPAVSELAAIGRRWDVPLVSDIGSGRLSQAMTVPGLPDDEPDARSAIAGGADLVLFSGDKLLGGPQAGIVVGRRDLIAHLDRHPMHRALRVDSVTLAGLAATLRLHLDPSVAAAEIPALAAARTPMADLRRRAEAIATALAESPGSDTLGVAVVDGEAYLGGGTAPARSLPSVALRLRPRRDTETAFATRLRGGDRPVVARVQAGAIMVDLRSLPADTDSELVRAIRAAASAE